MRSDKDWLMGISSGLWINADKNKKSEAGVTKINYDYP